MRTTTGRKPRRDAATRTNDPQSDGLGGTITGGPMPPLDLLEILDRGARPVSRGGAVSGAAHVMDGGLGAGGRRDSGITLSDGSRISFASVETASEEDSRVLLPI
jgi:hypothetical protein